MVRSYKDDKGRIVSVIARGGRGWPTVFAAALHESGKKARIVSAIGWWDTYSEAQEALDAYAEKHGWKAI